MPIGAPNSLASWTFSSGSRFSSSSAKRNRCSARSAGGTDAQLPESRTSQAAATAASISALPASGTS